MPKFHMHIQLVRTRRLLDILAVTGKQGVFIFHRNTVFTYLQAARDRLHSVKKISRYLESDGRIGCLGKSTINWQASTIKGSWFPVVLLIICDRSFELQYIEDKKNSRCCSDHPSGKPGRNPSVRTLKQISITPFSLVNQPRPATSGKKNFSNSRPITGFYLWPTNRQEAGQLTRSADTLIPNSPRKTKR